MEGPEYGTHLKRSVILNAHNEAVISIFQEYSRNYCVLISLTFIREVIVLQELLWL